ncbi:MAG: CRISPR-associated helicase Cas3' [Anaerolineaceae bacterium]|nr:CRISPR-associated helicase Cas3' [Anaerolineaceae bacterium]
MSRNYDSPTYHPLLCHMVDVSMVAREMWTSALSPGQRNEAAITLGFGSDDEAAGRWCALFAGLHDLGKASPSFQLQGKQVRSKVAKRLHSVGLRWGQLSVNPPPHGTITAATLPNILEDEFGLDAQGSKRIAVVVGGHHGVLPRTSDINSVRSSALGTREWDVLRRDTVKWLTEVLDVPRDRIFGDISNAAAMALAGFVSIADWIGSNTDYFDYAYPSDLSAYARGAAYSARQALDDLGWINQPQPRDVLEFTKLFPHIALPNDLQRTVALCAREIDAPGLVIIEAPMGEGKTEAAMYLADHWAESAGRSGCYFALPTQATSNQMFGRVRDFLTIRYPGDTVHLQLLHGHASLSAEFQALRHNHSRTFSPDYSGNEEGADESGVVAAEWFTHRKRGLLAPFGVGTIDQALLAALQTKHVFVRLFGLARKTVIVDEVHAYDAYMLTLLERLLEWLAALGSPVVLLSATLPKERRQALLAAYMKGLGRESGPETAALQTDYPRISWTSASTPPSARTVSVSSRGKKNVALEWTDGDLPAHGDAPFPLGKLLQDALAQGGCAAVICNTVRRAQELYLALKPYFPHTADDGHPKLDLLHARYLFEDREAREQRALVRFGKPDGTVTDATGKERAVQRPSSAVLVSTQVIEQSLDLDFDLMVSDLAPADLLLQRAGRLHRHQRSRSPGVEHPRLLVSLPELSDGVPQFEAGTKAVYDQHVLLRTWLALRDRQSIRVPDDLEEIVEDVYDENRSPSDVSERLRDSWHETRKDLENTKEQEREEAKDRWIKAPSYGGQLWRLAADPREEDAPDFHQAYQALTRLAPPIASVVMLYGSPDAAFADVDHGDPVDMDVVPTDDLVVRFLRRSVSISDKRVVFQLLEQSPPANWSRLALLRNHRTVFLDRAGVSDEIGAYRIVLDGETGARVVSASEERL